jgi:hypothetical protein
LFGVSAIGLLCPGIATILPNFAVFTDIVASVSKLLRRNHNNDLENSRPQQEPFTATSPFRSLKITSTYHASYAIVLFASHLTNYFFPPAYRPQLLRC